jgi:hypothetical protein
MVPSIEAVTPLPALGVPLDWSTGQAAAHAPAQADWLGWSFSNRYRVRPLPSTRIVPRPVLLAETVATPDAPPLAGVVPLEPPVPPELEPELLLPHPAASTPTVANAASATSGRRSSPDLLREGLLVPFQMLTCVSSFAGPGSCLVVHHLLWSP